MASSTQISTSTSLFRIKPQRSWPCPENSIDASDCGVSRGRKTFWFAQGPAREAYNEIIGLIQQCLEERQGDLYEGFEESGMPHAIDCYMVGRTKAKARPYIVITCTQETFSKHIKDIIKASNWWEGFKTRNPGFDSFALLPYMPRHIGNSEPWIHKWVYTYYGVASLANMPIFFTSTRLGSDTSGEPREATLGNIVYVDGRPYGLTVAHPAHPIPDAFATWEFASHSDEGSIVFDIDERSDESDSTCKSIPISRYSGTNDSLILQPKPALKLQSSDSKPQLVGQIKSRSAGTPLDGTDWMLIDFEPSFHVDEKILQDITSGFYPFRDASTDCGPAQIVSSIGTIPSRATPVLVQGVGAELIPGVLSSGTTLVCLPGSSRYIPLYSVTLAEDATTGDCGKWIMDSNGRWYGHVIAASTGSRLVYIVPATRIVDDIRKTEQTQQVTLINPATLLAGLLSASDTGNEEKVSQLLDAATNITISDISRNHIYVSAVSAASQRGHSKIVQMLIEKGAHIDMSINEYKVQMDMAKAELSQPPLQKTIDFGASLNASGNRYTPALCAACEKGRINTVRLLLRLGANMELVTREGLNALALASIRGHGEIVKQLLSSGADVNSLNGTAIFAATAGGHQSIVRLLIDAGADVNVQNGAAIIAAAVSGHEKIVRSLIEAGADINTQEGAALYEASEMGHWQVVNILLSAGAKISASRGPYGSALDAALAMDHKKTVSLLTGEMSLVRIDDSFDSDDHQHQPKKNILDYETLPRTSKNKGSFETLRHNRQEPVPLHEFSQEGSVSPTSARISKHYEAVHQDSTQQPENLRLSRNTPRFSYQQAPPRPEASCRSDGPNMNFTPNPFPGVD